MHAVAAFCCSEYGSAAVKLKLESDRSRKDGFLFFALLAVFSADHDDRVLPAGVVSGKRGTELAGHRAWGRCAARVDLDLHLPEHGVRQCLVRSPPDRDDPRLLRRRASNRDEAT